MNRQTFNNGLRILNSIDAHELGDPRWWPQFRDAPARFLISADDPTADLIWAAMVKRGAATDAVQAYADGEKLAASVTAFLSGLCILPADWHDAGLRLNDEVLAFRKANNARLAATKAEVRA